MLCRLWLEGQKKHLPLNMKANLTTPLPGGCKRPWTICRAMGKTKYSYAIKLKDNCRNSPYSSSFPLEIRKIIYRPILRDSMERIEKYNQKQTFRSLPTCGWMKSLCIFSNQGRRQEMVNAHQKLGIIFKSVPYDLMKKGSRTLNKVNPSYF